MFGVTWIGMSTSLGVDVETSCAAARAGLSRPIALEHFQRKSADGTILGVTGHAVPLVTDGFEGDARLARLAASVLTGALESAGDPPAAGSVGVYLSIPAETRHCDGLELIPDEALKRARETEAEAARAARRGEAAAARAILAGVMVDFAPGAPGSRPHIDLRCVATSGHVGFAEALAKALADLRDGSVTRAVVGGCDSLVGEKVLKWLSATQRLKQPDYPVGLEPGEAAAFVVVERLGANGARSALALVEGLTMAEEPGFVLSGQPPTGEGLYRALASLAEKARWREPGPAWVVPDLNGEVHRAKDFGIALMRLSQGLPAFVEPAQTYPAESFGDTGAASGAVATCMAVRAFQRGYAPCDFAGVVSASDGAQRSAILLRRANARQ